MFRASGVFMWNGVKFPAQVQRGAGIDKDAAKTACQKHRCAGIVARYTAMVNLHLLAPALACEFPLPSKNMPGRENRNVVAVTLPGCWVLHHEQGIGLDSVTGASASGISSIGLQRDRAGQAEVRPRFMV